MSAFTIMLDGCAGATLGPGASCPLLVRFSPASDGLYQAALVVTGGGQVSAALTGAAETAASGSCAEPASSNLGCEFYAVTLPNPLLSQSTFSFAIGIVNPSAVDALITVSRGGVDVTTVTAAAGSSILISLPWVPALSNPGSVSTLVSGGGYRVVSNVPVAAFQFNPLQHTIGNASSFTNDASMVLPVKALTGNYSVATWAAPNITGGPAHAAVVATDDDTAVTLAGQNLVAGGGITNSGGTVVLSRGDVLLAFGLNSGDLSGLSITASKPVAVFAGHGCAQVPVGASFCDHLEEQIPPRELLRTQVVVPVPFNAIATPKHFVKVTATTDGTTLSYDPVIAGAGTTLSAGQSSTFEATAAFQVTATAPILVTTYMEGGQQFGGSDLAGDPAMSVATPTDQFRTAYDFLAPANYLQNWATVVAPTGSSISIDGVTVDSFSPIGTSGFSVATVSLCGNNAVACSGTHRAVGTLPFGLIVYGYGTSTTYLYPGGSAVKK